MIVKVPRVLYEHLTAHLRGWHYVAPSDYNAGIVPDKMDGIVLGMRIVPDDAGASSESMFCSDHDAVELIRPCDHIGGHRGVCHGIRYDRMLGIPVAITADQAAVGIKDESCSVCGKLKPGMHHE